MIRIILNELLCKLIELSVLVNITGLEVLNELLCKSVAGLG